MCIVPVMCVTYLYATIAQYGPCNVYMQYTVSYSTTQSYHMMPTDTSRGIPSDLRILLRYQDLWYSMISSVACASSHVIV